MDSSDKLFNRQRSLHQILGGGFVADVVLWRRKDVTVGILVVTLFAWVVFEISGYTLLSLVSSVLFLLFAILFLWAKSAAILNRPAPPLPHLYLSEEMVNEAAYFIRNHVNMILSVSEDIALGLVIVLTVPALYEKYEDQVDAYVLMAYRKLWQLYHKFDAVCVNKVPILSLEKKKLS
ncbi:reticulon-like protein B12 isoform X2 [Solanum tuberosum]|uniref:reticulon-like protein B12 isoform X2 n=1 Tax=Solanum tuberosum TaxID=4113 RepID=UPI00073A52C6|nr:PREDICTED: reticulon-like protein B12 isoform X2 [Solanum tuberosum]